MIDCIKPLNVPHNSLLKPKCNDIFYQPQRSKSFAVQSKIIKLASIELELSPKHICKVGGPSPVNHQPCDYWTPQPSACMGSWATTYPAMQSSHIVGKAKKSLFKTCNQEEVLKWPDTRRSEGVVLRQLWMGSIMPGLILAASTRRAVQSCQRP